MQWVGALLRACMLMLAVLCAGPAWGYVREVTKSGVPIAWHNPCVDLQIDLGSAPASAGWDPLLATTQAADTWSYPQVPGTDIRLFVVARPEASAEVGHDQRNVIVFRSTTWCREPAPVDDAGVSEPECYPASVLAVTSLFKNAKTGEILDSDIEFNAVDYTWGDLVGRPDLATANTADFQNALTHELGHVIGLDHNCYAVSDGQPRLADNTGSPEVDCYGGSSVPDAITQATMYPSVVLSDTARRTLSADDELGVSEIYPHAHEACPSSSNGGCSIAPARLSAPWWSKVVALVGTLLVVGLGARRCRRRRRTTREPTRA
jgi:hypothetical protein